MKRLFLILPVLISLSLTYNLFACGGGKIQNAQGTNQESQQIVPSVSITGDNLSTTQTAEVDRSNSCPLEGTVLCPFKSSNTVQTSTISTTNIQGKDGNCCASKKKDATSAKSVSSDPVSQPEKRGS